MDEEGVVGTEEEVFDEGDERARDDRRGGPRVGRTTTAKSSLIPSSRYVSSSSSMPYHPPLGI